MRTRDGIEADLHRLDDTIAAMPEELPPSALMARDSLLQMRVGLAEELDLAERPALDIRLEGTAIVGNEVPVDNSAALLGSLQEAVSSVAQALQGKATSAASLPLALREATQLRLAGLRPGSVVLRLRAPREQVEQDVLPGTDGTKPLMTDAVERVVEILQLALADEVDDDPMIDAVLPLGSRSFKHLRDLSGTVAEAGFSATLNWRSPRTGDLQVRVDRRSAARLRDALDRTRVGQEKMVVAGRLGGISSIRNAFELSLQDRVVTGRVREDVVHELGSFYEQDVLATLEVSTVRSVATGQERQKYLLVGLASNDRPSQPTLNAPTT